MSEIKKFKYSLIIPLLFLSIMWIIKIYEATLNFNFSDFGIFPLKLSGLKGIIFGPLIHGSFEHLITNSISFGVLCIGLFYFFRKYAYQIFALMYLITGVLVWIIGRGSFHIGISGIIYALASFIFFSGIFSKKREYIAVSLVVVFQYGSMIWGIFPGKEEISWESHFMGFITGIFLSVVYNKKIIADTVTTEIEEDDFDTNFYDFQNIDSTEDIDFEYEYKENEK